ncbi:MAG: polyprenol monophosphomannose synthase [Deltaproteobacteria bacterium]|nr:polyprenol monophosphomannose synthase [Deltaproteobacteria bacterium]
MKPMIVMPTYNEGDNIERMARAILPMKENFHLLIVDDNSPDGTGEIADRLAKENDRVHVIHRPGKMGLGTAYIDGFRYALDTGMDYILEMDADFSHDPKYLPAMLEAMKDADLVIGSRYCDGVRVDGWRFRRLLMSKFANMFASYVVIIPVWDFTAGFKCYRREVLEKIDLDKIRSDGYAFQIEMKTYAYRLGFRIKELPVIFYGRASGDSKLSKGIAWEAFWTVLRLRSPIVEIVKHLKFLFRDYTEFVKSGAGPQRD